MSDRLVCLTSFTSPIQAEVARQRLAAEGIESFVADGTAAGLVSFAGVKLHVAETVLARAGQVLRAPHDEAAGNDRRDPASGKLESWKCSKCGQSVEADFDVCWSCGTSIDGAEDPTFDLGAEGSESEDSESEDLESEDLHTSSDAIDSPDVGLAHSLASRSIGSSTSPTAAPEWICPTCGAGVADGRRVCPDCGTAADGTINPYFARLVEPPASERFSADEPDRADQIESQVRRAARAALVAALIGWPLIGFGIPLLILVVPLFHLYSFWLLFTLDADLVHLSPAGRRRYWIAAVLNALAFVAIIVLLGFLVRLIRMG